MLVRSTAIEWQSEVAREVTIRYAPDRAATSSERQEGR